MKSPDAIKTITLIFNDNGKNPVAAPAMFAWSMILRRVTVMLYEVGQDISVIDVSEALNTPARRRRTGNYAADLYMSVFDEIFTAVQGNDIVQVIAKSAVIECSVFDVIVQLATNLGTDNTGSMSWSINHEEDSKRMKSVLATLVRKATEIVHFTPGIVGAVLALNDVGVEEIWEALHSEPVPCSDDQDNAEYKTLPTLTNSISDVVDKFWSDPEARPKILFPARARFPHEPLPFLKIIRSLATDFERTVKILKDMRTYTQVIPQGFSGYDTLYNQSQLSGGKGSAPASVASIDEADVGTLVLAEKLCLFAPRVPSTGKDLIGDGGIIIPAGTRGKSITGSRTAPVVAMWEHKYSALTFFGRILECALVGGGLNTYLGKGGSGVTDELGNKEAVGEIISILTTLMMSSAANSVSDIVRTNKHVEAVTSMLAEASNAVAQNRDVVSIIFDLLEEELQASSRGTSANQDTEFVTIGLQFVDALLSVLPNRVWPYLARSNLLERYGREGTLMRITSGLEVVKGEYGFTCVALELFEDLVDYGIKGIVTRSGILGTTNAVVVQKGLGTGVSPNVQKTILEGWTHWGVDLFESYKGWKYIYVGDRMKIGKLGTAEIS